MGSKIKRMEKIEICFKVSVERKGIIRLFERIGILKPLQEYVAIEITGLQTERPLYASKKGTISINEIKINKLT